LAAAGEAWDKSKGPAACDNAEARKALPAIVGDVKAYAAMVGAKADDASVKAGLKKVHDGFEKVGKPCMMAAMHPKGAAKDTAKKPMDAMDHSMHHPAAKKP
jgi:hypothetical protein